MKYKQLYQREKRKSYANLLVISFLLFIIVMLLLDKSGSKLNGTSQSNLDFQMGVANAQTANGFHEMYLNKPPEYTYPQSNEEIIRAVFGDKSDRAIAVAKCESGLRANARNKQSTATGLFQIMASIHGVSRTRLENPVVNTVIAKELYDASGWNPWVSSIKCWGE